MLSIIPTGPNWELISKGKEIWREGIHIIWLFQLNDKCCAVPFQTVIKKIKRNNLSNPSVHEGWVQLLYSDVQNNWARS